MKPCVLVAAVLLMPSLTFAAESPARVEDLGWLSGCWKEETKDGYFEEYWMRPVGKTLLHMGRMVSGGNTVFFETIQIREEDSKLALLVTIGGKRQVVFEAISHQPRQIVFQTLPEAPLERLTYKALSNDALRVVLEKNSDGASTTEEFNLKRSNCQQALSNGQERSDAEGEHMTPMMEKAAGRAIVKEVVVKAPLREVWEAWSTSEGATKFFAPKANIKLSVGGPYEVFFDPKDERQSSKGMKILSYAPLEMISFQWNAPPDFPEVRANPIWVVVQLSSVDSEHVRIKLTHLGWKKGTEWEKAFEYFSRAWGFVMSNLERRFAQGPIDWTKL